jgi:hypothetical protein
MTIGGDRAEAQASAFAGAVLDFLNAPIRLGIAPSISAPASGSPVEP